MQGEAGKRYTTPTVEQGLLSRPDMQGEAGKRYTTPVVELLKELKQPGLINTAQ